MAELKFAEYLRKFFLIIFFFDDFFSFQHLWKIAKCLREFSMSSSLVLMKIRRVDSGIFLCVVFWHLWKFADFSSSNICLSPQNACCPWCNVGKTKKGSYITQRDSANNWTFLVPFWHSNEAILEEEPGCSYAFIIQLSAFVAPSKSVSCETINCCHLAAMFDVSSTALSLSSWLALLWSFMSIPSEPLSSGVSCRAV